MTRVTLLSASPRNPATGATTTVQLAGGGFSKPYPNGYRAGLTQHLRFKAALGFDGEKGWTGSTAPAQVTFTHKPSTNADLNALMALYWPDAAVTVASGEEGGALATVFTGTIASAAAQDGGLILTLADLSVKLSKPVCTGRFAGTGGVEGGSEAKDRVKRRSWGRCFNIEGRILDKTTNVVEFGALDFPWQQFDDIRDVGRSYSPITVVAWAGSIAATLTVLKSTAVANGAAAVAPSIACAKLWDQPRGPCTADIRGEIGASYVETAPEIAERIVQTQAGPAFVNVSAMASIRGGAAGIHIGDESETAAQAVDRALLGVSLAWFIEPAGTIRIRPWTLSSPIETLQAQFVERVQSFAPVKTRRLGYQKNYRQHNDGEIAAVLLYTADLQGQPASLADLDPTASGKLGGIAAGADVTASQPIVAKLDPAAGRVVDPTIYNTQSVIGLSATTNLSPSYTVGGSNVTVNLPAHTRTIAGASGPLTLSYGAGSGVVAFSAYWIAYIDDPTLSGVASPTIGFTNNPDNLLYPGRYFVASGVAPASGGSGGSTGGGGGGGAGGGAGCVAAASFMPDGRLARDYARGDRIRVLDYSTLDGVTDIDVTSNELVFQPCVLLTSLSGIRLIASRSAPLTVRSGVIAYAPDALDLELPVEDEQGFRWEKIVAVEDAGDHLVAKIRCHDATYAAGLERGRFIYTHNPSNPKP